jgi:hypothetical protein
VGLERGPLSLMITVEDLLERKISCPDLECPEYGLKHPLCLPRGILYPQKVDTNFADRQRSLGSYSSIADSGHGI